VKKREEIIHLAHLPLFCLLPVLIGAFTWHHSLLVMVLLPCCNTEKKDFEKAYDIELRLSMSVDTGKGWSLSRKKNHSLPLRSLAEGQGGSFKQLKPRA
jgi:hypothetical protein